MPPVFERLFSKLIRRWKRYQDASRDYELVTELAARRAELDDARAEITAARKRLYPEPESSDQGRPGVDVDSLRYRRALLTGSQDSA